MPYGKCSSCGEYGFLNERFMPHVCKPEWQARASWVDDDCWESVRANNADEAAEKYAERYDCEGGDYAFLNARHDQMIVLVRKPAEFEEENVNPIERFSIRSEAVPTYYADKIDDPTLLPCVTK